MHGHMNLKPCWMSHVKSHTIAVTFRVKIIIITIIIIIIIIITSRILQLL